MIKRELILKTDRDGDYRLSYKTGSSIRYFCKAVFTRLCPSLRLKKGEKIKVLLTQTKKGFKLERM